MTFTPAGLAAALDKIAETIGTAERAFDDFIHTQDEWREGTAAWYLEVAFTQLAALTESLRLPALQSSMTSVFAELKDADLLAAESDPDGDPYLKAAARARQYLLALQGVFASDTARTITKDLASILRDATYSITNSEVFDSPPSCEADVHRRVENVLRCVFPDLVHKPRLAKPIKNFEPDTGIPSIQTLIEYKFISERSQVATIADQILADTRGFVSKDWNAFVYVIYETERFRQESQWRELLAASGVEPSTVVVVMSGHAIGQSARKQPNRRLQPTAAKKMAKSSPRRRG